MVFQVKNPAGDAFSVLSQQGSFAGRDLYLVEIVPGFVAIIYSDINHIRFTARDGINHGPHALRVSQIPGGGNVLAGGRVLSRVDGINQIVLVTGFVLHEENVLAVAAPKIVCNRAGLVGSDGFRRVEWVFGPFDPDIASAFQRLDERDELAVGRNLGAGDFRVTEE